MQKDICITDVLTPGGSCERDFRPLRIQEGGVIEYGEPNSRLRFMLSTDLIPHLANEQDGGVSNTFFSAIKDSAAPEVLEQILNKRKALPLGEVLEQYRSGSLEPRTVAVACIAAARGSVNVYVSHREDAQYVCPLISCEEFIKFPAYLLTRETVVR